MTYGSGNIKIRAKVFLESSDLSGRLNNNK